MIAVLVWWDARCPPVVIPPLNERQGKGAQDDAHYAFPYPVLVVVIARRGRLPLWCTLTWLCRFSASFSNLELVHVLLPGEQELKERFVLEAAGLADSEQPQVVICTRSHEATGNLLLNR